MIKVSCRDCRFYQTAPYEAPHTGCWQPDNMLATQKDAYLNQQQLPGDHRKINQRGDCTAFVAKAKKPTLWERFLSLGA